jgi:hypothetical protein
MDAEKYSRDIEDYIVKMKRLNNLVEMSGMTLKTTIKRQLTKDLRRSISLPPSTNIDDEWIQIVVKASKMEEFFLAKEKLLKGYQERLQERKSNPGKGKEVTTTSNRPDQRKVLKDGLIKHFQYPKDRFNLMSKEVKEQAQKSKRYS